MTPEQKVAFVLAQVALLNAEIAALQAENATRTGHLFDEVIDKYKGILAEFTIGRDPATFSKPDRSTGGIVSIYSRHGVHTASLADLFAQNQFSSEDLAAIFQAFAWGRVATFGGGAAPLIAVKLYEPGDEGKSLRDVLPPDEAG